MLMIAATVVSAVGTYVLHRGADAEGVTLQNAADKALQTALPPGVALPPLGPGFALPPGVVLPPGVDASALGPGETCFPAFRCDDCGSCRQSRSYVRWLCYKLMLLVRLDSSRFWQPVCSPRRSRKCDLRLVAERNDVCGVRQSR